jgi:SAM-dependent methyltransferase
MADKKKIKGTYRGKLVKEVDNVSDLYDKGYYDGQVYSEYTMESESRRNQRRINFVQQYCKSPSKLLDVGCAKGFFLFHAKKAGFEPYGIDISNYAIHEGQKLFGDSVVCCNVEESIPFSDEVFDVITCWDLIEHLRNPFAVLRNLGKKLKKGGLIFVETCNYDSLSRKLVQGDWDFYAEGYHQTPEITIARMENWLRLSSFQMVEAFTDYINIPLSNQLTKIFHLTNPVADRCLYPLRQFEYISGKLLFKINPNFGDLIFCVAKKL